MEGFEQVTKNLVKFREGEAYLRKKGVIVPPAVYPAVPKNKARLRFCVISEHQPDEIVEALDKLLECAKEAGIQLPE